MIVWLASYPRSGNTFFRVILNSIFNIKTYSIYDDKKDIGADKKTSEIVGHEFLPEDFDIVKSREEEKIYYIKTHDFLDDRVDDNDKVIYLIRDGRESIASFTKHQNIFSNKNQKIIDTIYGNNFVGTWEGHVSSWNPKYRDKTLLIKFEELIKEPLKYIEILSSFLNIKPTGESVPTFEELKEINPKFFRNGKINSWQDTFSEGEHISFWLKNSKAMMEYGYNYEKIDIFHDLDNKKILLESINQNNYLIDLSLKENEKTQLIQSQIGLLNQKLQQRQNLIEKQSKEIEEKDKRLLQRKNLIEKQSKEIEEKDKKLLQRQNLIEKQSKEIEKKRK